MAVASTVTVNITAETAKFENGLKKAKKAAKGFGGVAAKAFKAAAVATAVLASGLAVLTRQSLATVDAQRKAARTLGTTQKVFAGLSLAAEISGLSVQSFEKALKKQQKAIVDANDGLLTQKRAFDRLGLSAKDLIKLPVEDQFKKITTALNTVENATLKVGIASDIFGAKNSDLINVLELGEKGLDGYIDKVQELGIALTEGQTKAIEDANDANLILKKSFEGLGNQLAAQFAPSIKRAAEALTRFVTSVSRNVERVAVNVRDLLGLQSDLNVLSLEGLRQEYALTQNSIFDLNRDLEIAKATVAIGPQAFGAQGPAQVAKAQIAIQAYAQELAALKKRLDDNIAAQKELLNPPEANIVDPEAPVGAMDADKGQRDFDAAFAATRTAAEKLQLKLAEIRDNLANNPLWSPDLAGRQAQSAVDAYLAAIGKVDDEQAKLIAQQKDAAEAATRAVATPAEALQYKIAEIRNNLETNPFWSKETAGRQAQEAVDAYLEELKRIAEEQEKAAKEINEYQRRALENMQDILADYLYQPWEDGLDGMLKSFGDMLRKMISQLLASKILDYFFGFFGKSFTGLLGGGSGLTTGNAIGTGRTSTQPRMVGENGPEVFTPGAAGSIRPLGSAVFNMTTNINGGAGMDAATLIPILEENNRKLKGEFVDELRRGTFA